MGNIIEISRKERSFFDSENYKFSKFLDFEKSDSIQEYVEVLDSLLSSALENYKNKEGLLVKTPKVSSSIEPFFRYFNTDSEETRKSRLESNIMEILSNDMVGKFIKAVNVYNSFIYPTETLLWVNYTPKDYNSPRSRKLDFIDSAEDILVESENLAKDFEAAINVGISEGDWSEYRKLVLFNHAEKPLPLGLNQKNYKEKFSKPAKPKKRYDIYVDGKPKVNYKKTKYSPREYYVDYIQDIPMEYLNVVAENLVRVREYCNFNR